MNELSKVEHLVRTHPGVSAAVAAGAGLLLYRHYSAAQAAAAATAANDQTPIVPVSAPTAAGSDSLFASDTSPAGNTSGNATGGTYSLQVPTGYPVPPTYQSITPPSGYQSEADAGYAAVGGGLRGATVSATVSSANTLGDACSLNQTTKKCGACSGFGCFNPVHWINCGVQAVQNVATCGGRILQTGALAAASAGEIGGAAVSKIPGVAGTPYGQAASILGGVGQLGQPQAGIGIPYQQQTPYGYQQQPNPYVGYPQSPYGFTPGIAPYVSTPTAPTPAVPVPTGKVPSPAVQQYGLTLV